MTTENSQYSNAVDALAESTLTPPAVAAQFANYEELAAKKRAAIKTLIANDPDVVRLIAERDDALNRLKLHGDGAAFCNQAMIQLSYQLELARSEVAELKTLGGSFRAFFRRLFRRA